jgi:transposase-like protein
MEVTESLRKRFNDKVHVTDGCHFWRGASRGVGYGCIKIEGKVVDAHRVAWVLANGQVPEGMFVLHSCDHRSCVNPVHLRLGSAADNAHDAVNRGRMGGSNRVLSYAQAEHIRALYELGNTTIAALATEFGVGDETVRKIIIGETYTSPSIDLKPTSRAPLTPEQIAQIRNEYESGVSKRQLARKHRIAPTTLHRLLAK